MRVTHRMITDQVMANLYNITERLLRVQDMLSSGKTLRRPSDDPVKLNHVLLLRTSIRKLEQYTANVEDGLSWLNLTDTSLNQATSVLQKVRTLAVQGANGTLTPEDRAMIATEVEKYLEELVGIGNTAYAGRYVFSGTETLTTPFVLAGGRLTYQGNGASIQREISEGVVVAIGVPGDGLFFRGFEVQSNEGITLTVGERFAINGVEIEIDGTMTTLEDLVRRINEDPALKEEVYAFTDGKRLFLRSRTETPIDLVDVSGTFLQDSGMLDPANSREAWGILKVVRDLAEHLRENRVDLVSGEDLEKLDQALDLLLKVRAEVGARTLRLENALGRFEDFTTNFKKLLSLDEDIDVAEVVVQLQEHQNVYQMALAAAARLMQPTLLDFLR
ncbi:flagellar hook-associated protein FlgL [Candidatus Caldatribacterium saccharofermentans]|uniref:flagellar hook-associated protein FlgL n=1 Tax=Candidatus Caldatribacterium saccharofermentans TaxID=1454753 RepID=UPI003CFD975C